MSDVSSERITIRLPESLGRRLKKRARLGSRSESSLVREAVERYLEEPSGLVSAYELAQNSGLIGRIRRAPVDLSTNKQYLKGLGKRR